MSKKKSVVLILSGGMDSTALLHYHLIRREPVRVLSFNYGQRHSRELEAATNECNRYKVPHETVNLSQLASLLPGSSQTDPSVDVPTGKYDEDVMKLTVVPNRNMIMLSIALGHAIAYGFNGVSFGAHAGDHAIYPDCRPAFAKALNKAAGLCDWKKVKVYRPFLSFTKADIVRWASDNGVDLSQTYSCYAGQERHCGKCGTCIERREAFYLAKVMDPTEYAADAPMLEDLVRNDWKP